jgi:cellulose synthase/poly-beta-1,6-N-acetylglucosamine synthase-like glycosyltransferase
VDLEKFAVAKRMKPVTNQEQKVAFSGNVERGLNTACLGVIMPVFNESKTIDEIMRRVLAQPNVCELVVVDDASSDGTIDFLNLWRQRDERVRVLVHQMNHGKGAAIRTAWAV